MSAPRFVWIVQEESHDRDPIDAVCASLDAAVKFLRDLHPGRVWTETPDGDGIAVKIHRDNPDPRPGHVQYDLYSITRYEVTQ